MHPSLTIRSTVLAAAALATVQACAPSRPATTPAAEQPARTDFACPDNTDTPQILEYTVGVGHRAFRQNPANLLPSCYVAAIGSKHRSFADSVITMTLDISDELLKKNPDDPMNLAGRLSLLSRARRFAEVPRTFDRLVALEPARATLANYRLALIAAQRGQDTVSRLRYLRAAARKFPKASSIVADYNIQRQIPRLRALIDSTHQILRLDPRRADRYATLASIYGNLDMPDSALAYTRLALARGVARNAVAPSLQSLVGVVMRKAQLLDAPDIWTETLPTAKAIDATLSTDASKHLLALTLFQIAAHRTDSLTAILGSNSAPNNITPEARASACAGLRDVRVLLDQASARLAAGGARFSPQSVPTMRNGIAFLRGEQADRSRLCPG